MRNIIIASSSTIHGSSYLEYITEELKVLFKDAKTILFIPYARPGGINHVSYTKNANNAFAKIGKKIKGIHEYENPIEAIKSAEGIFVGGGNTFVLTSQLYKNNLIDTLKHTVKNDSLIF